MPVLRDVCDEDLPIFFEHQCDEEALRMASFVARSRTDFLQHWRVKVLPNSTGLKRTIVVGGEVAGFILSWNDGEDRLVGYWIGREHWGRGVATAALLAFLQEERVRPLRAHVAVSNRGSIRVLEKCGFRPIDAPRVDSDGVEECLLELRAVGELTRA